MAGDVVLISGGARGIGEALARAHRERGDTVVVADLHPTADDQLQLDVRDPDAFRAVAERVVAEHGRIDVFHDNAGIAVAGTMPEMTRQHWDDLIDIDLRGVVHGVDAVYPLMRAQGFGHIVVMGSLAGILPVPSMVPYSAVKSAVVTMSRALRVEARRHGVKVTVVCPAFVETPLLDHINPGMRRTRANRVGLRLVRQLQGPPMDPDALARIVLTALPRNPETVLAPRPLAQLAVLGERLVPGVVRWASGLAVERYLTMSDKDRADA
ncbi:SDR family oxidoreductase [Ornithinimicrobium pekingense]|uniref:Short-chain dehydrogenase n=1 Tax=Ornithinimicrobium pekingense TaxID=384677 RepID=A0ABQ2FE49_9MICO|nr:SDR family oxidoreductase [Ornithinimicrobium pekingense]GGK78823.1 short-chain dehydrogenase [Ornithinimicrobium pekingense]